MDPLHVVDPPADARSTSGELTTVIRPAAVLGSQAAMTVLADLHARDVASGGVWNASPTVWQRYDIPWDGPHGTRGNARLMGTVAVVYDSPRRHEVTIYRITVTVAGREAGWTTDSLADDALEATGQTLHVLPRVELAPPPETDPFKDRDSAPAR